MMIFLILSVLTIVGITFYSGSSAVLSSLLLFYFTTTYACLKIGKSEREQQDLSIIFNIAFLIYLIYSFIAYLAFVEAGGFFRGSDQMMFYEIGDELGRSHSIKEIFRACFIDRVHIEQEGAYFLFGTLAYIANNYFDGNSVLFQIINVSFFAILINVFVYKTLLFYVDKNKAFRFAIFYLVFAHILSQSPWILRDNHITLLYAIAIYIVHLSFSLHRLVFLVLLQVITIEFRFEHGLAFSFFTLIYTYVGASHSKNKNLYYGMITVISLSLIAFSLRSILSSIATVTTTLDRYTLHTEESAEDSGGLGATLLRLPFGLRQIASVGFSQFLPFPPWLQLSQAKSFLQGLLAAVAGFAPIFWGYVSFTVVLFIRSHYKKLPRIALWLLIFSGLFLIANSANMTLRRIIPVYPIIYISFVFIQSRISKKKTQINILRYTAIYCLLLTVYIIIKYT